MTAVKFRNKIMFFIQIFSFNYVSGQVMNLMQATSSNYGPYILNLKSFEFCRGPKTNNITDCTISMLEMEQNTCTFNVTFHQDSRVDTAFDKGKSKPKNMAKGLRHKKVWEPLIKTNKQIAHLMARVGVYTKSYSSENRLWDYRTNTPCQHVLYTGLLQKIFKVGRSCIFKKGTYPIKLNFTQTTRLFHGSSFFYGDMLFKAVATGSKGNILCLAYNLSYKKKP